MNYLEQRAVECFLPFREFVKGAALRYAPLPGYSEDIAQQVFIEFVSHCDRWDLDNDVRPILLTITKNVALQLWRERKRIMPESVIMLGEFLQKRSEEKLAPDRYETEKAVLSACLNRLPKRSRELIDLYYFDALKSEEIGNRYNISAKSVMRAIYRIRERLKKCIHRLVEQPEKTINH